MSFKKIMLIFYIGLPLSLFTRVFQILFTIDYDNGFFANWRKVPGTIATVVILAIAFILAVCAYKAYKTPEHPPKNNPALAISSGVVALALISELVFQKFPLTSLDWQISCVKIATAVAIVYFAAVALQGVLKFRLPALFHVVPFFYIMAKVIFTFISISSLALISDNILLMTGYCLLMLFFINYGKLYNKLDTELNFRKILATGLSAATICGAQSLAYFGINALSLQDYLHSDITAMFTLLTFAIFTTVFTISHFRKTV